MDFLKNLNPVWNVFINVAVDAADPFPDFFQEPREAIEEWSNSLGCGMYSEVYPSTKEDFVIKIGNDIHDDGWLHYALRCIETNSKYSFMPTIKKLLVDFNSKEFFGVIERLEPLKGDYEEKPDIWIQYDMGDRSVLQSKLYSSELPKDVMDEMVEFLDGESEATKHHDPFRLDAHHDNWMTREDGSFVLTDPFSRTSVGEYTKKLLRQLAESHPNQVRVIEEDHGYYPPEIAIAAAQ
ncbi:hypothetical protein KNU84_gp090 [Bacteriophage DSS3_VP1]|uniref:Uncharacterized protein n=1 Tax=Bacteriophage DSS3_VP1 TaxID=2664196 RepID=A0A7S5KQ42_9CAUD|nr:hypothetical protein KNU84_gp090 [Bacteriophage DSS3_VP1]QGH74614.1 hypothetical protein DSS3VP1_00046 [Bacteriophage DSS3_VP1]